MALVTGASGGIGRASALALARAPAPFDLALQYQGNAALAEETAQLCRAAGVEARTYQADLTQTGAAAALLAAVTGAPETGGFGRLDALLHAAGHLIEKPLAFVSPAEIEGLFEIHAVNAALLAKHALRWIRKSPHGRVVLIGSLAGEIGLGNAAAYAAAKGALSGLARSLALETARWGTTVNVIAPGFVETAMTAKQDEEQRAAASAKIPLGRFAAPGEIGALAAFLCSAEAAYITGQTLVADGGLSLG
jgi:3-oxoacyl-[acyl-carrier protein] reductase